MDNKRAAHRSSTIVYLEVRDSVSEESYGRIVDISLNGMLIVTDQPRRVPESFAAWVRVPPGIGESEAFTCQLSKRWTRRDKNPALTLIGFAMQPEEAVEQTIAAVIEHYSFGRTIGTPSQMDPSLE